MFNKGIEPALVEGNNDRQIYDFTIDDGEFRLFIKYRADGHLGKDGNYRSWYFTFSQEDINEIKTFLRDNYNLLVALVCGAKKLNESELVIINSRELKRLFIEDNRTSITISRLKGEKAFRISIGGGRSNSIKIPTNRLVSKG